MSLTLVCWDGSGAPIKRTVTLTEDLVANCVATADLYKRVSYVEPWVGHVSVVEGRGVGGGAFVGPPREGCVEIAYFTLKDQEGKGYTSQIAAGLVGIA